MSDIYKLYDDLFLYGDLPAEYIQKQLHKIPSVPVVDRVKFLCEAAKDKVIFDMGATDPLSSLLKKEAKEYYSTNIVANGKTENFYQIDLDRAEELPNIPNLELVIAGELIEHLSNAGHFLNLIYTYGCPVILTTPNAHSRGSDRFLQVGIENVNRDHVAWYSYHTLKVLIDRHNFELKRWFWYNGQPIIAEGLIFEIWPK